MSRVEERRRRVEARLEEMQRAFSRDVERAQTVRDAALAVFGTLGLLLGAKALVGRLGGRSGEKGRKTRKPGTGKPRSGQPPSP